MSNGAIRLVVMAGHRLVRDALAGYLGSLPDFEVLGHSGTADSLVKLCRLRRPDAALVHAAGLKAETVGVLGQLRQVAPATMVVVTYAEVSAPALRAAVQAGIVALVPGSRGLDEVLRVLREHVHGGPPGPPDGVALTDYDLRVLSLLSLGHNVPEMAALLGVSPRTVENHKRRLYAKLGAGSCGDAVSRAISLGLVEQSHDGGPARTEERGRRPLVVVIGRTGPARDRVQRAVVTTGLSVVATGEPETLDDQHWARWHRGPLVAVLVDPAYADWQASSTLRARTIVVRTTDPDPPAVGDVLIRGAFGLLREHDVDGDLATVLSAVVRGYLAVERARMDALTGWLRTSGGAVRTPALTSRDTDILAAIADGKTIRQTGQLLGITAKSVENAQGRLYRKLGARNRAEALMLAHRWGLLGQAPPGGDPSPGGTPSMD